MSKKSNNKIPKSFRYLLWSYNFSKIDPEEDAERIIINTINYGNWEHWQWLVGYYGERGLKEIIENTPASEFRKRALKLISLLLDIKSIKYASRGAKIRAEKNILLA
ncbi:MAG: hypothetical protein COS49_00185 [Candidatus Portnoybacteria bacterium CG03_land_8_20_14_0_80_41_10]|uniref:DUF6922 domain-containing protein n=1 Tax=Candidatus Portnoybacteria bacterium CG03_land_8_20_14_0_80_41_10 TaxID=1974808 RepID=A0A2M7BVB7_9BACT|nr:MAG: hypothetical protein COS49_00185 [Candidatus Portnoybacteria bacterium CG03_land_8_20_14_0_80_41_10]